MRGIAKQVESRGIGLVVRGEPDLHGAATDVEHVEVVERVTLAVDTDCARAANVEHADFTALKKVFGAQFGIGGQGKRRIHRGRKADDCAIEVNVIQIDFARLAQPAQ